MLSKEHSPSNASKYFPLSPRERVGVRACFSSSSDVKMKDKPSPLPSPGGRGGKKAFGRVARIVMGAMGLFTLTLASSAHAITQEDVFKSIHENVDQQSGD